MRYLMTFVFMAFVSVFVLVGCTGSQPLQAPADPVYPLTVDEAAWVKEDVGYMPDGYMADVRDLELSVDGQPFYVAMDESGQGKIIVHGNEIVAREGGSIQEGPRLVDGKPLYVAERESKYYIVWDGQVVAGPHKWIGHASLVDGKPLYVAAFGPCQIPACEVEAVMFGSERISDSFNRIDWLAFVDGKPMYVVRNFAGQYSKAFLGRGGETVAGPYEAIDFETSPPSMYGRVPEFAASYRGQWSLYNGTNAVYSLRYVSDQMNTHSGGRVFFGGGGQWLFKASGYLSGETDSDSRFSFGPFEAVWDITSNGDYPPLYSYSRGPKQYVAQGEDTVGGPYLFVRWLQMAGGKPLYSASKPRDYQDFVVWGSEASPRFEYIYDLKVVGDENEHGHECHEHERHEITHLFAPP